MTEDLLDDDLDLQLDTFSLTFAHEALDRDLESRDPEGGRQLLLEQVAEVARALDRGTGTFRSSLARLRQQRQERLQRAWKGPEARRMLAEMRSSGGHFRTFVGFSRVEKQIFQRYEESESLADFLGKLQEDQRWWRGHSPLFGEKRAAEIHQIGLRIQWGVQHVFDEAEKNLDRTFGPQLEKAEQELLERLASRVSWLRVLLERAAALSVDLEREVRDRFDALIDARLEAQGGDVELVEGLRVVLPAFEEASAAGVLETDPSAADPLRLEGRFVELLGSLAARRDRSAQLARRWRFDDDLRRRLKNRLERLGKDDEYVAKALEPLVEKSADADAWLARSREISAALGRRAEGLLRSLEPFRCLAERVARSRVLEEKATAAYAAAFADAVGG